MGRIIEKVFTDREIQQFWILYVLLSNVSLARYHTIFKDL